MTLEEIIKRQQQLNSNLSQLVESNTFIVNKIAGEKIEPQDITACNQEERKPNGLLEELELIQYETERLFYCIYNNSQRLHEATFSQETPSVNY